MSIKLSKSHWWVTRLAYRGWSEWRIPDNTNICSLFWRGVFTLLLGLAGTIVMGVILSHLIVVMWVYPYVALEIVGWVVGALLTITAMVWGFAAIENSPRRFAKVDAVVDAVAGVIVVPIEMFKGWKNKYCALVKLEDTHEI